MPSHPGKKKSAKKKATKVATAGVMKAVPRNPSKAKAKKRPRPRVA